jgi:hypothetical protein
MTGQRVGTRRRSWGALSKLDVQFPFLLGPSLGLVLGGAAQPSNSTRWCRLLSGSLQRAISEVQYRIQFLDDAGDVIREWSASAHNVASAIELSSPRIGRLALSPCAYSTIMGARFIARPPTIVTGDRAAPGPSPSGAIRLAFARDNVRRIALLKDTQALSICYS